MTTSPARPELTVALYAGTLACVLIVAGPLMLMLDKEVSEVWLVTVVILFLVSSGATRDFDWAREAWFRTAFAFWVWLVFVSAVSAWPWEGLRHALPWIRYPLFAAAIAFWFARAPRLRGRLLEALIVGVCIMLVILMVERLQNPDAVRLYGPLPRPRAGWYMIALGLPAALWALSRMGQGRNWLWAGPFVGLIVANTISTGEIYVSILLVFSIALYVLASGMLTWRIVLAGSVALLLCAVLFATNDELLARFTTGIADRLPWLPHSDYYNPWSVGLEAALRNPGLGTGAETFQEYCETLLANGELARLEVQRCYAHPHNLYLQAAAETGLPGLALFALLAVLLILRAGRDWHWHAPNAFAAMALVLMISVFWPISSYSNAYGQQKNHFTWFLVGWALVCAGAARGGNAHEERAS